MKYLDEIYYKTIAIDPYKILLDKNDNIHPQASEVINLLLTNSFNIILWSTRGENYCKKVIPIELLERIKVIKKEASINNMQKVFFCLDTDIKFASQFKIWTIILPYDASLQTKLILKECIENYINYVNAILSVIDNI